MTKFFSILIIAGILAMVVVASATVNQNIVQTGKGDNAIQIDSGHTDVAIRYANINNNAFNNGVYTQNIYATLMSSGVLDLDKGVIEQDRVMFANQVLVQPIVRPSSGNATTYYVTSGVAISVYTLYNTSYDYTAVHGEQSMMTYDPVYDKMNHGTVDPDDIVPYFTTKCSLTPSADAGYIVFDNRYFDPQNTVVQIVAVDSGVPQ
jgi:hypothetical protein